MVSQDGKTSSRSPHFYVNDSDRKSG